MSIAHISHLPQEILDIIVDELAGSLHWYEPIGGNCEMKRPSSEIVAFQNYALISRRFTDRVQKHLFNAIIIPDDDSVENLSSILKAKPHLRYAIKHVEVDETTVFNPVFLDILHKSSPPLTLRIAARGDVFFTDDSPTDAPLLGLRTVDNLQISGQNVLMPIIRSFSNIKTMHLSHVHFTYPIMRLDGGPALEFLHLTKLVIVDVNYVEYPVPKELITGCVNLETLVLQNVNLDMEAPGPEVTLPKIINLTMGATHGPITNVVDVSRLRTYEDHTYLRQSRKEHEDPDLAEKVYEESRDIIRACSDTLEAFVICDMVTSCMGGRVHKFDLRGMKKLTSLTMDFDLDFDTDKPVDYILDTIRTLRPRAIARGAINVKVRINCGNEDGQLLATVMHDGKWVDVLQELVRLSQIGSVVLTVQLESTELPKVADTWCLSNLASFPETENVSVVLESWDLGLLMPDFLLAL